jgi:hypothetical protein
MQFESLYPIIFWKANYAVAVLSEKVWYIEGCPETQPQGIASFPGSRGSPRHYSI